MAYSFLRNIVTNSITYFPREVDFDQHNLLCELIIAAQEDLWL